MMAARYLLFIYILLDNSSYVEFCFMHAMSRNECLVTEKIVNIVVF